jgi:energy-coupling factor transporter transmembrane protein EcfT
MKTKHIVIALCLLSFFIPAGLSVWFFPAAILFLLYLDRHLFRFVTRFSFIMFFLIIVVFQSLFSGEKDISLYGINFSSAAFYNGMLMILRAAILIPSITYLSRTSDKASIRRLFERIGVRHFDELISTAQNILPLLKENFRHFLSSARKNGYYTPVEFTARFIVLVIKTVPDRTYNLPEKRETL